MIYAFAGMIIGALFLAASLLGLSALICTVKTLPQEYLPAAVRVLGALAGFLSGYSSARIPKRSGLITGAISALLLAAAFSAVRASFHEVSIGIELLLWMLIYALCGAIGGIIAVNRKTDDRRTVYKKK